MSPADADGGRCSQVDRYKTSSIAAYDGPRADRYDESLIVRLLDLAVMDEFVLAVLGESLCTSAILDVGCGTGRLLERLAEAGARDLTGSDLTSRMVELSRTRLSPFEVDVELYQGDAETGLPWSAGSFDVVVATGVLHHFYNVKAALAEVKRVLRENGRLVVADPCFLTPLRETFNALLRVHPREGDFHFYSLREVRHLLCTDGWEVERCERLNWWAYGVSANRGSLGVARLNERMRPPSRSVTRPA